MSDTDEVPPALPVEAVESVEDPPALPAEPVVEEPVVEETPAVEEAPVVEEAVAPPPAPVVEEAPAAVVEAPAASSSSKNTAWQERAKLKDQDNGGVASKLANVTLDSSRGGLGFNAPGYGVKVTHFAAKAKGRQLPITEECDDLWNRVLDNDDPLTFVVMEYDSSGKSLSLKKSGTGGLKDFVAELEDDKVCWGGFRCWAVDDRGNVTCERAKFVFVQWMPSGASTMRKAKMGPHKGSVKEVLHSVHLDVQAEDKDAFEEGELVKSLQAATGAHKPNAYRFEEGVLVSADYYGTGIPGGK